MGVWQCEVSVGAQFDCGTPNLTDNCAALFAQVIPDVERCSLDTFGQNSLRKSVEKCIINILEDYQIQCMEQIERCAESNLAQVEITSLQGNCDEVVEDGVAMLPIAPAPATSPSTEFDLSKLFEIASNSQSLDIGLAEAPVPTPTPSPSQGNGVLLDEELIENEEDESKPQSGGTKTDNDADDMSYTNSTYVSVLLGIAGVLSYVL